MVAESFDVAVVGGRCAGAALATHLARAGASVVVLEAGAIPGGRPLSTHLIQPPGMDELDELGLGGAVRRMCPPLRTARLAFDGREVRLPYRPGRPAHCLRREKLDPMLQRTAAEAGASIRARTRAVDVVRRDDGRVVGVTVVQRDGRRRRLRAELVVGADGRHSTLAKLVGAREYLGYDGERAAYWAYWPRPEGWRTDELLNEFAGDEARVVFPTDDGQLLIATCPAVGRARVWRGRHAEAYIRNVAASIAIGPFVRGREPAEAVRGVIASRYCFRESAGPGWALVGDAGHHKEFVVGLGISDALRDARELSRALLTGEEEAIYGWWRRRDRQRLAAYRVGRYLGRARGVTTPQRLAARCLAAAPGLRSRFPDVVDGRLAVPPLGLCRLPSGA